MSCYKNQQFCVTYDCPNTACKRRLTNGMVQEAIALDQLVHMADLYTGCPFRRIPVQRTKLIGITGRAGAGKDAFAEALQASLTTERVASLQYKFSARLKDAVRLIFQWDDRHIEGDLKEVVDDRYGITPRYAMQTLGSEWGRDMVSDSLWVDTLMAEIDRDFRTVDDLSVAIVTDVRFTNEAEAIKDAGGMLIRIERQEGLKLVRQHQSEAFIERLFVDRIISNSTTLEGLQEQANLFAIDLLKGKALSHP